MRLVSRLLPALGLLALPAVLLPVSAAEVYVPLGLPGVGIGFAQPVGDMISVRGDYITLGTRKKDSVEDGIAYHGDYKLGRAALLVDLFPLAGSFRFTAGVTFNDYKINLDASGAGGTLTIGNRTYVTTAADGLNVLVDFPKTTPYLGMGWGHQLGNGWRFSADLGAAIGKAKVTATPRGALASQATIQADIDTELAQLRDGVGKVKAIPQVSIGVGYSF